MKEQILNLFEESRETVRQTGEHLTERICEAVEIIVGCYRTGGGVFLFGNGGSASDAQHIACELVGRFLMDRPPLKARALSTNSSTLTSIANDYDYESVFARQLEGCAGAGDVAVGISTSGDSPNVVTALQKAREIGMKTVALTGAGGGKCAEFADVLLDVPSTNDSPRVQEAHAVIYHVICQLVEAEIFGDE
ncbi:MAG: D-sedoheptulose-7-phosphate isomerase [Planctomycetota bacterium]|jgi:D-sedoheptulose 7-phosphate isomerase